MHVYQSRDHRNLTASRDAISVNGTDGAERREQGVVLEEQVKLSESLIWGLQREFYNRNGTSAWSSGAVPFYITNNAFIARAYAEVVIAYIRDLLASQQGAANADSHTLDLEHPLYIIELGAGSGRFGYLFMKHLDELKHALGLKRVKTCYVMTDFTERNLDFLRQHPALQARIAAGTLDFAVFDAERDAELRLSCSGTVLSPGALKNPAVVIANYIFDSIAQDAFRIQDGRLLECLATIMTDGRHAASIEDPAIIEHIAIRTDCYLVDDEYYPEPEFNDLLRAYAATLGNTWFQLPVGALRCIRNLASLADNRMLLISADKGYCQADELHDWDGPYLAVHGGCFSMMVNYHAIAQYIAALGGSSLHTRQWESHFGVSAFFLGGAANGFAETKLTFDRAIEQFGPYQFQTMTLGMKQDCPEPSLLHILCLLRLSNWDPGIIIDYAPAIIEQVGEAPPHLEREIRRALDKVWDNYFPIGERANLAHEIASILQAMDQEVDALRYYERSLELYGVHPSTLYNMGLCHYRLGNLERALELFDAALELNGEYGLAREWRIRAAARLAAAQRPA